MTTSGEVVPYATPGTVEAWEISDAQVLVNRFIASRKTENTRRSYERDLRYWLAFCAQIPIDPIRQARRIHVDVFIRALEAADLAPSTIARRLSSLAQFYKYLMQEDVLTSSPVEHVTRPHVSDEGVTPGLTHDEGRRLLTAAHEDGSKRTIALLTLLLATGLRINEALSSDIENISSDSGHRILRIKRKGRKAGRMVLPPAVLRTLDDYLGDRTSGPIFVTSSGRRMQQPEAWRMVRRMAKRADIHSPISPHSLRSAFITGARERGVPLEDVQDAAGHVHTDTTRRYDRNRHKLDGHAAYAMAEWFTPYPTEGPQ